MNEIIITTQLWRMVNTHIHTIALRSRVLGMLHCLSSLFCSCIGTCKNRGDFNVKIYTMKEMHTKNIMQLTGIATWRVH